MLTKHHPHFTRVQKYRVEVALKFASDCAKIAQSDKNKLLLMCTVLFWMHPHSIFIYPCAVCVVGESEASGVRACQPLSTTTCMPFLGMKTTAHPRSHDLACQTILYSYTCSFKHSFNHDIMSIVFLLWKGAQMQLLLSLHKADKCTQMREKLCRFGTKATSYYKNERQMFERL